MPNKRALDGACEGRITSILRMHALVFDSRLFGLELGARDDYESLLNYADDPEPAKLRRVASVLSAHRELFGSGSSAASRAVSGEMDDLIRYLASLARAPEAASKRAAVLPRNLGLSFARKGLGYPLFGSFRPAALPHAPGVILKYRSKDADGSALIAATRLDGMTSMRYDGLGVEIASSAPWLHCVIAPSGERPRLLPKGAFGRESPTEYRFDHYSIYIAAGAAHTDQGIVRLDPLEYQYAYYFADGSALRMRLNRYLRELLSGMFSVPSRQAESIADEFIGRSL